MERRPRPATRRACCVKTRRGIVKCRTSRLANVVRRWRIIAMWHVEDSVETTADPASVWRTWTDVNGWPRWVSDFEWSRLDGAFAEGASIANKAKGLPVARVRIAKVEPGAYFRTESRFLGMHLVFDHWIASTPAATRIRTRMSFGGPFVPILRLLRGRAIVRSTRVSLQKLAALAERGETSAPAGQRSA
jgi:hypothetical protein